MSKSTQITLNEGNKMKPVFEFKNSDGTIIRRDEQGSYFDGDDNELDFIPFCPYEYNDEEMGDDEYEMEASKCGMVEVDGEDGPMFYATHVDEKYSFEEVCKKMHEFMDNVGYQDDDGFEDEDEFDSTYDELEELTKVIGGKKKTIDAAASKKAKMVAKKVSKSKRHAAAIKAARTKGKAGAKKAAMKAAKTRKRLGESLTGVFESIFGSFESFYENFDDSEFDDVSEDDFIDSFVEAIEEGEINEDGISLIEKAENLEELTKIRGGKKVNIDLAKSRLASKAARKISKAKRKAAAIKAARKRGKSGSRRAAMKAARTRKRLGEQYLEGLSAFLGFDNSDEMFSIFEGIEDVDIEEDDLEEDLNEVLNEVMENVDLDEADLEFLDELRKVKAGKVVNVDPEKSKEAKKAAMKMTPAERKARSKKAAKKVSKSEKSRAGKKAAKTKAKLGESSLINKLDPKLVESLKSHGIF